MTIDYTKLSCRVLDYADRDQWRAARHGLGVGASQAAALFGVCPSRETAFSLWSKFRDPLAFADLADEESEPMEFGNVMERPILERYEQTSNHETIPWRQTSICASDWGAFATPDAIAFNDGPYLVEVKTRNEHSQWQWDERGVPLDVQVQVAQQMEVTGIHRAVVVVLFGNRIRSLRVIPVDYDAKFGLELRRRVAEFNAHVAAGTVPEVDDSPVTGEALFRLHPNDNGEEIDLPAGSDEWLAAVVESKAIIKATEKTLILNENRLKAALGHNTYGLTPGGKFVSWKTTERTDGLSFRTLRPMSRAPR